MGDFLQHVYPEETFQRANWVWQNFGAINVMSQVSRMEDEDTILKLQKYTHTYNSQHLHDNRVLLVLLGQLSSEKITYFCWNWLYVILDFLYCIFTFLKTEWKFWNRMTSTSTSRRFCILLHENHEAFTRNYCRNPLDIPRLRSVSTLVVNYYASKYEYLQPSSNNPIILPLAESIRVLHRYIFWGWDAVGCNWSIVDKLRIHSLCAIICAL